MLRTMPTIRPDFTSTVAKEEYGKADFIAAVNNFLALPLHDGPAAHAA